MSTIGELLDTTTAQRIQALAAGVDASEPAKPRRLTEADAIDIDVESEAMIEAACIDCKVTLMIDPKVPEGIDPEAPRVPICSECASIRVRIEAIENQRNVMAIKRPQVAKHKPRTTDGIDHPVTVKHATKENDMDLDQISDAELGAMVRAQMKATLAEKIVVAVPEVVAERKADDKRDKVNVAAEQEDRKTRSLPGFMVGTTLEIPELDLANVPSLDEAPSAKERSVYNKARFRLTKESPLDPEETTYRLLGEEHLRLQGLEAERVAGSTEKIAEPKAKKAKAPKATVIVADVSDGDEAKVIALAGVLGVSIKKARKILASR